MDKTVVIHQPDFLPYLGFFHRLLESDLYVVLDDVQFVGSSRSWHRRDKIKTKNGWQWITVSVEKTSRDTKIKDVYISKNDNWKIKNINLIIENYKNALYFNEIYPYIKELYDFQCEKMIDFNIKSIEMLMKLFDINIEMNFASKLQANGKSNELLVDILKKVNGKVYLSGIGARDYYNSEPFEKSNIKVIWQEFNHPIYPQQYGEFIPYLSSIDLLFNCGIEQSRKILRGK
ncbi:WbqC family protein [Clostridium saccharoperbutylacetonicum]|uniref:WbqC family protein n=1 Tax=Clostridium saccharoperbutylacetonicum TaxID=36745 RepID=UPI000983FFD8|nr:WbqC family protein [Clostridium saccharoperbutylacetonicum]AQR96980.1 WbqC-like protein family protein [Clostridium saccharoperbutylacetonicum]NSB32859.1 hypothetical protein [Clostridium saccharoperbutylacetonicum]